MADTVVVNPLDCDLANVDFSTLTIAQCTDIFNCLDFNNLDAVDCQLIADCIAAQDLTALCAALNALGCITATVEYVTTTPTNTPTGSDPTVVYDTTNNILYVWDPVSNTWNPVAGTGTGNTSVLTQTVTTGNQIASHNDGNGTVTPILETVTDLTYAAATNTLSYTDEAGVVNTLPLSESSIANTIAGNRIATHTSADGTVTDIDETITTLTETNAPANTANHSWTYTSENGTVEQVFESLTSLTYNSTTDQLEYVDENNSTTTIVDEVVINAGPLTGNATVGQKWGWDTTNSQAYYSDGNGGAWTAVPVTGGGGGIFQSSGTATGNQTWDLNSTTQSWDEVGTITLDNTPLTPSNVEIAMGTTFPSFEVKMEGTAGTQGWIYADPNESYVSYDSGGGAAPDSYIRTNSNGASLQTIQGTSTNTWQQTEEYLEINQNITTAPTGTPSGVWLYEVGGELFVRDSAGNSTQLSSHDNGKFEFLDSLYNPLDQLRRISHHIRDNIVQIEYSFLNTVWALIGSKETGEYTVYSSDNSILKSGTSKVLQV